MNPNGAQTVTSLMSRSSNFTVMDISFIKKQVMLGLARDNFVGFGKKRRKPFLFPDNTNDFPPKLHVSVHSF